MVSLTLLIHHATLGLLVLANHKESILIYTLLDSKPAKKLEYDDIPLCGLVSPDKTTVFIGF